MKKQRFNEVKVTQLAGGSSRLDLQPDGSDSRWNPFLFSARLPHSFLVYWNESGHTGRSFPACKGSVTPGLDFSFTCNEIITMTVIITMTPSGSPLCGCLSLSKDFPLAGSYLILVHRAMFYFSLAPIRSPDARPSQASRGSSSSPLVTISSCGAAARRTEEAAPSASD